MSHLIKHYLINRDNGTYALTPVKGYVYPNIKGLDIVHRLTDENNILYCLSTCPEYFEHSVTISQEELSNYQNNSNITIISSIEREVEIPVSILEPSSETTTITVYDVVYRESYSPQETQGLWILTQEQWDAEIVSYDTRQKEKRYSIIREIREELLSLTDWLVIKAKEQGTNLTSEFKTWRQSLRDITTGDFPTEFPTLPSSLQGNKTIENLYGRYNEVRNISMINNPLPPLPEPELPG